MSRKPLAWYVVPGVIVASVTALGAMGTLIVKGATYLTLPERVEAGESVNQRQDESLSKLTAIQETWQKIYEQQAPSTRPFIPWQEEGWCCDARLKEDCWLKDAQGRNGWWRCDE